MAIGYGQQSPGYGLDPYGDPVQVKVVSGTGNLSGGYKAEALLKAKLNATGVSGSTSGTGKSRPAGK